MLSESKLDSQQGAPVLNAGQANRVRQVYVQGWKHRKCTGEMVAPVAKVFTICTRVCDILKESLSLHCQQQQNY